MGSFISRAYTRDEENVSFGKADESSPSATKYTATPPMRKKSISIQDPRSVTAGITRTPIHVTPPLTPQKYTNITASAIPRRLQVKQFLETNFDETLPKFTIGDPLDPRSPNVSQPRTPIKILPNNDEETEIHEEFSDSNTFNPDPRSPSINFDRTPILKPKSPLNDHRNLNSDIESKIVFCESSYINIPEIQVLPDIIQNLRITKTSLVEKLKEYGDCNSDSMVNSDGEEEKEEKEETKETDPHPSPIKDKKALRLSTQELIDNILFTAVQKIEQERNEMIQIWQDSEHEKEQNNKVELEEIKYENRTPLGNRSINQIQVHKKPKNSHIPILKNKAIFTKNQQENTPPAKKTMKLKANSTQWDLESTVVI